MKESATTQVAVFVDVENVLGEILHGQTAAIAQVMQEGNVYLARAYGSLLNTGVQLSVPALQRMGFQIVQPAVGKPGNNAADMHLALDVLEECLGPNPPDTVIIVSSDCDYLPLIHKLKQRRIRVVGVGVQGHSSKAAMALYDRFVTMSSVPFAQPVAKQQAASPAKALQAEPAAAGPLKSPSSKKAVDALLSVLTEEVRSHPETSSVDLPSLGMRLREKHGQDLLKAGGFSKLTALVNHCAAQGLVKISGSNGTTKVSLPPPERKSPSKAAPPQPVPSSAAAPVHQPQSPMKLCALDAAESLGIKLPSLSERLLLCERVVGFFRGSGGLFLNPPTWHGLLHHVCSSESGSTDLTDQEGREDMLMRLQIMGAMEVSQGQGPTSEVALSRLGKSQILAALSASYLLQISEAHPDREVDLASAAEWLFESGNEASQNRVKNTLKLCRKHLAARSALSQEGS